MIGADTLHLVSSAPGEESDSYFMQDFRPTELIHYVEQPDHSNAVQELKTIYTDQNTDTNHQAGVTVEEKTYAFTKDLTANAMVADYIIHKRPIDSLNTFHVSDSTAAALFMD